MADLKIYPSKLKGEVKIPPSKSMAHRAIICAALSDGLCIIENIDYSDDIIATIDAMNSLGAKIVKHKNVRTVPIPIAITIEPSISVVFIKYLLYNIYFFRYSRLISTNHRS